MSNSIVRRIGQCAEATAIDATWAQWSTLTNSAVPVDRRRAWTIIDPEALILASLAFSERERRLEDMLAAWARQGAFLSSVQRIRSLASAFPDSVQQRVGDFARYAVEGGDKRWKRLATASSQTRHTSREKQLGPLQLIGGPALMLRLRAGFGVGAKADLLSFLLGLDGTAAGLKVVASATGYSERTIRNATEEMTLAGLIHEIKGRPSSFHAEPQAWAQLLHTHRLDTPESSPDLPPWRFWAVIYAFLADIADWALRADQEGWSPYVASSRARDLYEEHEPRLRHARPTLTPPHEVRGAEYLRAFEDLVERICSQMAEDL